MGSAFTATLDSLPHKGSGQTGGPRAGLAPGPAPQVQSCSYCPEQAEIYGRMLACTKRVERWCPRHFVAHAKKHSSCRTCFREATILGAAHYE